jgi:hypothetical protein
MPCRHPVAQSKCREMLGQVLHGGRLEPPAAALPWIGSPVARGRVGRGLHFKPAMEPCTCRFGFAGTWVLLQFTDFFF